MTEKLKPQHKYMVEVTHPDFLGTSIDFSEFAFGAGDVGKSGAHNYLGGFRGRPDLAASLVEMVRLNNSQARPVVIRASRSLLRSFFRFLDAIEEDRWPQVNVLEDIGIAHGVAWSRHNPKPVYKAYNFLRYLIECARGAKGIEQPLGWFSIDRPNPQFTEILTPSEAHELYICLKRRAFRIFDRWKLADMQAASGRNLFECSPSNGASATLEDADFHATYRAFIETSCVPVPSIAAVRTLLVQRGWSDVSSLWTAEVFKSVQLGIYPSFEDCQVLFHLYLLQTGWNPQTALDLDVSNQDWATPIGSGEGSARIWYIVSSKNRSDCWQDTVSREKPSTAPYAIISTLIERTRTLRKVANEGEAALCSNVNTTRRSPWLYAAIFTNPPVVALGDKTAYHFAQGGQFIALLAAKHNEEKLSNHQRICLQAEREGKESPEFPVLIPPKTKATDFRDCFIGNEFLQSGYNFFIAMFAAGHKKISSTSHYLRSRAWRLHSEKAVRAFQEIMWNEIEVHQLVDPAILKARCEAGDITTEQRDRWLAHKNRTYMGMGCKDFTHPPKGIDPTNDGKSPCRNQTSCIICSHGLMFRDSMPYLARRFAELQALQSGMPTVAWNESGFPRTMRVLAANLELFAQPAVADAVAYWHEQIADGLHIPLIFEGVHYGR